MPFPLPEDLPISHLYKSTTIECSVPWVANSASKKAITGLPFSGDSLPDISKGFVPFMTFLLPAVREKGSALFSLLETTRIHHLMGKISFIQSGVVLLQGVSLIRFCIEFWGSWWSLRSPGSCSRRVRHSLGRIRCSQSLSPTSASPSPQAGQN